VNGMDAGPNLTLLSHEVLFHTGGKVLNIAESETQLAITAHCTETGAEVLFLDNLSCLASGMVENDADAWEKVLHWLLDLRRRKIAVVIVHHAGRNGEMRGTSKREDAVFWIIRLDRANTEGGTEEKREGARFVSRFTKDRNSRCEQEPTSWHFDTVNGVTTAATSPADSIALFRYWIESGLNTASDLAAEMGISKGTVSKLAKRAEKAGWLKVEKRRYVIVTDTGNASRSPFPTLGGETGNENGKRTSANTPKH